MPCIVPHDLGAGQGSRGVCSEPAAGRTAETRRVSCQTMRLGLSLGYQTAWSTPADHLALAQEADRLGYSVVWAAEAYGSDAPTILSWIAGQTSRIDVGTAVM